MGEGGRTAAGEGEIIQLLYSNINKKLTANKLLYYNKQKLLSGGI